MKYIIMVILIMFLININCISSEIKHVENNNIEQIKKDGNFLKDYGVLITISTTIIMYCISRVYLYNEKKNTIKKIKLELNKIQSGILKESQNILEGIDELYKNKDKEITFITQVPSKYSIKLDLMYVNYIEKLDEKNIEYLDSLYFINSKYKTGKKHLINYISNIKNELDLDAAKNIIEIVEDEIKKLKP